MCSYLIGGVRPCSRQEGHKGRHRPAKTDVQVERDRSASASYRAKNPEKVAAAKKAYVEANRDKVREYQREYQKKYRAKNPERSRAAVAKYYRNHKEESAYRRRRYASSNQEVIRNGSRRRRARFYLVPHEDYTREQLISLYGSVCYLCSRELPENWTVDHLVPVSLGGWDVVANLRPVCRPCNSRKHDRLPFLIAYVVLSQIGLARSV